MMKRYPEYKKSGVEWIGEIPQDWEVLKVKHVGLSSPSKNNPKTACLKEKPVVFLPMERVHTDGTIDQELRLPYSQLKNGYTYFEEGDILIAKVTPCFENGKIVHIKNLATSVGFGSTEFIVIRPDLQRVFPPFLYYIFRSDPLRSFGKHVMTSAVGLKRVPTEFVENFQVPIPVYQEQTQIANFLDRKTEQIDKLIRIKERKIELLQEQRITLINHAVTKGLDQHVEMKPSGVEWIGEIPKHWITIRCTNLFELKHIKNTTGEINLSVYRDYGVIRRDSRDDNHNRISEDTSNYKLVEPGDFVLNKMKCWQGSLGISEYRGIVSPAYTVCKPKKSFFGKYFHYLLRSNSYIQEYKRLSYGIRTGQWELRFEDFKDMIIPYPPRHEQEQIANILDQRIKQIDELVLAEQQIVELLKEYRQSLITEAVTGKIDVRNEV